LREQLEADMAESEQVMTPFNLSASEKVKALFDKYLW